MLSKSDLKSIKELLNASNNEIVVALTKLVTRTVSTLRSELLSKKDFGKLIDLKLDEKIKFLPTKVEFYCKMDELMGEVKAMRESQEIHAGTHSEINDRLGKIENTLQIPNN